MPRIIGVACREHANNRATRLSNDAMFGGKAKRNEYNVDRRQLMIHQGSAACFPLLLMANRGGRHFAPASLRAYRVRDRGCFGNYGSPHVHP